MKVDKSFIEAMRHATQLIRTKGPRAATQFIQGLFRTGTPVTPPVPAPVSERADDSAAPIENLFSPAAELDVRFPDMPGELPHESGQFISRHFSSEAGARNYKLYVPLTYTGAPVPLLVMLHGCTQDPNDFAIGTRANRWAERRRFLVVYPEQMQRANSHRCWNWFLPQNQQRGRGEPAIIAGITQQVIDEYQIDARRVYVAGLSAGGAMAAIVGQAYPELFAAIGIHSGLPVGAAHNAASALAVMKTGQPRRAIAADASRPAIPLIVLQGDADRTVNPANAKRLIEDAVETHEFAGLDAPLQSSVQAFDATEASHAYRRTRHAAENGTNVIEQWEISGAGHAWSGGDAAGSHTDARGPDATRVMLEFFDQHATAESGAAAYVMSSDAPTQSPG